MASFIARTGDFFDPDQTRRTLLALNDQRNLSQFCDVVLRVLNTQIYAHSNVLAAASPYFESFLGVGADCPRMFSQKHPQIIEIHIDTKDEDSGYGEAVSKVVEFMYTSRITLTPTLVFQVVEIGKIMQMDKLLEFCEQFQNGEDSNYPRDIATCTTGLQEIASLLGSRAKTVKQISVATETEEIMFKKIEASSQVVISFPPLQLQLPVSDVYHQEEIKLPLKGSQTQHVVSSAFQDASEYEGAVTPGNGAPILQEAPVVGFDSDSIDQNDASLLLAISNVRPPVCIPQVVNNNERIEDSTGNIVQSEPQVLIENCLSSYPASLENTIIVKSDETACDTQQPHAETQPTFSEQVPHQDDQSAKKDFILEDISDLVKFNLAPTILVQPSKGQGRGRPRGRGRGRGRGRKPGRPRKLKEEPDSDPEFEAFINRVEKGDSAVPVETEEQDESDKVDDKEESFLKSSEVLIKDELFTPSARVTEEIHSSLNWKSRRRSKPSLLRKDYVMHSLTKKSRKQEVSKSEEELQPEVTELKPKEPSAISTVKLVCQKCDFITSYFKLYRHHMKTHPETDPRYFICDKCQFKTTKSREFNSHKHKHMKDEFICSLCSHQSNSVDEFVEHSQKHDGGFPFFCTECDSRFRTKNQLIAHKPKHQVEKPFVCAICGSGFKWKHALKNHMITHSATKDQLCDECGYATAHKSQLKAHKLIHTGHLFKCPVAGCHFEATKRQNLKYHMVTHTHEKPHQCDVCGQSFSLIKNMRRHMLLHTNTRPFSCKICSFSTTRYDKLKEHNLKLHNIGEPPVSKKDLNVAKNCSIDNLRLINSSITYVSPEGITINTDGAISAETLQTIAQLATAQCLDGSGLQNTTINIEQTSEDGTVYPIIATVQSFTNSRGEVQYIAEIPD